MLMLLESSLFPKLSWVHVWCCNFNIPNPMIRALPSDSAPNLPYVSYYSTLDLSGAPPSVKFVLHIKAYFIFGSPNCPHLSFYSPPPDFCRLF